MRYLLSYAITALVLYFLFGLFVGEIFFVTLGAILALSAVGIAVYVKDRNQDQPPERSEE